MALIFAGTALLTCAMAAGEPFPSVNTYPGYADVPETAWFAETAKICYETGLITGSDQGFEPYRTVTNAEAAAIAARMSAALTGKTIAASTPKPGETLPWYHQHMEYLRPLAVENPLVLSLLDQPEDAATRLSFLQLLAVALPVDALSPINAITALPDSADPQVLRFYNAGILTGVDEYGFFRGAATLTRAEAAAMVSRVARESLRISFTPTYDALVWASGLAPDTAMFTNGVTAQAFLAAVNREIAQIEGNFASLGLEFDWHYDWTDGGDTTLKCVTAWALESLGVTENMGLQAYRDFDLQVYYSQLISLTGAPLGADGTVA